MKQRDLWLRTVESSISTAYPCFNRGSRREGKGQNHMNGSLHVGLAALGAAIAVGLIGMKASDAVGRNPVASTKILVQSILAIAFAEAIVFYALFLIK
jgi:F-type H+-transporting ATPase subunit c